MSDSTIDERLSRLAPTGSPDPERFTAARAELLAAVATDRREPAAAHAGDMSTHLAQVPVDVVVPGPSHRRGRRRAAWSLAAAGVVLVAGVALFFRPAEPVPASGEMVDACRDLLTTQVPGMPEPVLGAGARLIASEDLDGTALVLFAPADPDDGDPALCHVPDGDLSRTTFTRVGDASGSTAPAVDEVTESGTAATEPLELSDRHSAAAAWGRVGETVESVTVTTADGQEVEGVVSDGYWVAWWLRDAPAADIADPSDVVAAVTWTLTDGDQLSRTAAWPGADEWNPQAERRREECRSIRNWQTGERVSPVLEDQVYGYGTTLYATDSSYRLCVQEISPPYELLGQSAGTRTDGPPAPDGIGTGFGAGFGGIQSLYGQVGSDVDQVVVTLEDGTRIDAEIQNGYWLAQAQDPTPRADDGGPWDGAELAWYLADGSLGGRQAATHHS